MMGLEHRSQQFLVRTIVSQAAPVRSRLKVLIVQLTGILTWRAYDMRHRESGQSLPDQCFEVRGRADLH
jgi:hypothetical protein